MDIEYMEETLGNFRKQKIRLENSNGFYCEICDYVAKRQWNLDKHKLTAKHQKNYKKLQVSKKSKKDINKTGHKIYGGNIRKL